MVAMIFWHSLVRSRHLLKGAHFSVCSQLPSCTLCSALSRVFVSRVIFTPSIVVPSFESSVIVNWDFFLAKDYNEPGH